MPDTIVKVGENEYLIGTMNAKKQFHVLRRLGPILASSSSALEKGLSAFRAKDSKVDDIFSAVGPIAAAIRDLSDADVDYIMEHCLSVCRRRASTQWAPITTPDGMTLFQDITLAQQLELLFHVLRENFMAFFTELLGKFQAAQE